MTALTATAAEARGNFSKIAEMVNSSGMPVTILKNSKPWVTINPIVSSSPVQSLNWDDLDVVKIDPTKGFTVLPSEWDDPADDGLYDDLV